MPFSFDDSAARQNWGKGKSISVPPAGMRKYHDWRRYILAGRSPSDAARLAGDMNYELLQGNSNLCSVRLTQQHRVLFSVVGMSIKVLEIGGHY
ncbi:hypothetical protein SIL08_01050 [Scandinavium sp. V105_16]|uniref:Uncharacterized protein n=1 Tax=Scandinavium lactucae TaxID=3095028 RepID=A0AAJ2S309_9ENTR|nr:MULTISPECIES: hypothetical protein [unclassified Scandinavium]MDX6018883.1 hypothetical protein [Scandinavium sp. V105_16]MDX6030155.1 hypothetical protein [Scandinavium sp. V105_12]MDX6039177.1 hypothetical protein [Scandinavium sp. V105_6]MDX6050248.1 hypothetical protein [Scandinavium sp. V105_1]